MLNSKWNYIFVGFNCAGALLGAAVHSSSAVLINLAAAILFYCLAECKKPLEESEVIQAYLKAVQKAEEEKNQNG